MDDTFIGARAVYDAALFESAEILHRARFSEQSYKDLTEFKSLLNEIIHSLRPEFAVDPAILDATVYIAAKNLGLDYRDISVQQAITRVQQVQTVDTPKLFSGAIETIDLFNRTGLPTVLLTHGRREWTQFKQVKCGLVGKFARVICLDIYRSKSEQWEEKPAELNTDPSNILSIGDNLHGDIIPPVSKGA